MVYVPPMSVSDEALRNELIGEMCKACPVVSDVAAWYARVTTRTIGHYGKDEDETFEAKIFSYGVKADGSKNLMLRRLDTKTTEILPYHQIYRIEPWYDTAEAERIKAAEAERIKQQSASKPAPIKKTPAKKTAAKPAAKPAA